MERPRRFYLLHYRDWIRAADPRYHLGDSNRGSHRLPRGLLHIPRAFLSLCEADQKPLNCGQIACSRALIRDDLLHLVWRAPAHCGAISMKHFIYRP